MLYWKNLHHPVVAACSAAVFFLLMPKETGDSFLILDGKSWEGGKLRPEQTGGLQVYIRQLRLALQGKTGEALKTDEVRILAYISLGNFYNSHHSLQIHTEFIY